MIYHLEDKPKSGAFKRNGWLYHYATLCDITFPGGQAEHRIAGSDAEPTCETCAAIAAEREETAEIQHAEVRRIGRMG